MEYFACAPPHFFLQPRSCQGGPGNIWLVHPWQQTLLCSVDLTRKSYKKKSSQEKKITSVIIQNTFDTSFESLKTTCQSSTQVLEKGKYFNVLKKLWNCIKRKCWNKCTILKQLWMSFIIMTTNQLYCIKKSIVL